MSVLRPDARERRTMVLGATVVAAGLFAAFGVMPVARRWSDREAAIAGARDRVARLAALSGQEAQVVAAANAQEVVPEGSLRVLRGRTVALVASDLQGLLQDHARLSRVSVTRLEVSNPADSAATPESGVTASVSATTDIYGVADLLARLQSGPVLLTTEALSIASNPVLRGNLLQVALTVRAPFVLEP